MPHNKTTTRAGKRTTGRLPKGRRTVDTGKKGARVKAKPPSASRRTLFEDAEDDLNEEPGIDLDDPLQVGQCHSVALRQIEMLREERLLRLELTDAFDP